MYIGTNWICCLSAAFIVVFSNKRGGGWLNAIAFGSAIATALPGCLHLAYFADSRYVPVWHGMPWLIGCCLYGLGGLIYAIKVPEFYFRKTFDIVGSSH